MKTAAVLALGALAAAQFPDEINSCGQGCVMRMQATAVASFGCEATDVNCYCQEPNFGYGIRDCANEACGGDQAQAIISYGRVYCSSALDGATGSAVSALTRPYPTATAGGEDEDEDAGGAAAGAGGSSTPVTTSAYTTVISSGDSMITSSGSTTVYGAAGGAAGSEDEDDDDDEEDDDTSEEVESSAEGAASTVESAAEGAASTVSSGAEEAASTVESAAEDAASTVTSAADEAASTVESAAESATSRAGDEDADQSASNTSDTTGPDGAAPRRTAAPVVGAGALAAALLML